MRHQILGSIRLLGLFTPRARHNYKKCIGKAIVFAVTAAAFCTSALPAHAENLQIIYKLALENDHQFRAAEAEYLANSEAKRAGRAGLLPNISASVAYTETSADRTGVQSQPVTDPDTGTVSALVFDTSGSADITATQYNLNITQALFNLSAWNTYKAGAATTNAAEAQFSAVKQALIIRTAQAYFDTLLAASNLETSLAQEQAFGQQLEQAKQRFEVGLSAITDVHEAQATYDASIADRVLAEGRLNIAFEGLEVLTGRPFKQISTLRSDFEAEMPQPADREAWVNRALASNYELKRAAANAKASKYQAKAANANKLPTLSVSGSFGRSENDSFTDEFLFSNSDTDSTSVSLNLQVPLYNGGGLSSQARRAKQTAVQQRENYLQIKRDVVQNARTQHLNVLTGVSTVKARAQSVISRQSALESTQAGYRVGTRNLVDVLSAQQALFQSRRDYNTAVFEYLINTLNLKDVAGQLGEADIVAINSWLDPKAFVSRVNF